MSNKQRIPWIIGLAVIIIAICVVCFFIGRGHTVYFENKTVEYNGQTVASPYKIEIIYKGETLTKLYDKERGEQSLTGQTMKFDLLVTEKKGGEEVPYSFSVKLPYNLDGIVLKLPALLAGLPEDAYIEEFVSLATDTSEDTEEEVESGEEIEIPMG